MLLKNNPLVEAFTPGRDLKVRDKFKNVYINRDDGSIQLRLESNPVDLKRDPIYITRKKVEITHITNGFTVSGIEFKKFECPN